MVDYLEDSEYWKKLEFKTVEEAHKFYNDYAHRKGFATRIDYEKRGRKTDDVLYIRYLCNKEGFRKGSKFDPKNKSEPFGRIEAKSSHKRFRREERTGCGAHITMHFDQDRRVYVIKSWVLQHNHDMHPPEFINMLRSNRQVSDAQRAVGMNENTCTQPKPSDEEMTLGAGGEENLCSLPAYPKNHLMGTRQKEMQLGEANALQWYFRNEAFRNDPSLYYDIEVDSEEMITNIFWADGRMKMDYHLFGDSITFDTTCREKFRPLALFVGLNHNHESCVFGAALLYDATMESFEWLFRTFLKCMHNKAPTTIFTDQDQALAAAIKSVFPSTYHALCTWHIVKNARKNLRELFTPEFESELDLLMYGPDDEKEFNFFWEEMIKACFPDGAHSWLETLHGFRTQWSSAWVKQQFTAGMDLTPLSKLCNSNLKGYLKADHNLHQFFVHFNKMVEKRRDMEKKLDFQAADKLPNSNFPYSPLAISAAEQYTPNMFAMFQEEYSQMFEYQIRRCPSRDESDNEAYCVHKRDSSDHSKLDERTVLVQTKNIILTCICRLYETFGLFCRHILIVMDVLGSFGNSQMRKLPSHYVMKRWTKKTKIGVDFPFTPTDGNILSESGERYLLLISKMLYLAALAYEDERVYEIVDAEIDKLYKKLGVSFSGNDARKVEHPKQAGTYTEETLQKKV